MKLHAYLLAIVEKALILILWNTKLSFYSLYKQWNLQNNGHIKRWSRVCIQGSQWVSGRLYFIDFCDVCGIRQH